MGQQLVGEYGTSIVEDEKVAEGSTEVQYEEPAEEPGNGHQEIYQETYLDSDWEHTENLDLNIPHPQLEGRLPVQSPMKPAKTESTAVKFSGNIEDLAALPPGYFRQLATSLGLATMGSKFEVMGRVLPICIEAETLTTESFTEIRDHSLRKMCQGACLDPYLPTRDALIVSLIRFCSSDSADEMRAKFNASLAEDAEPSENDPGATKHQMEVEEAEPSDFSHDYDVKTEADESTDLAPPVPEPEEIPALTPTAGRPGRKTPLKKSAVRALNKKFEAATAEASNGQTKKRKSGAALTQPSAPKRRKLDRESFLAAAPKIPFSIGGEDHELEPEAKSVSVIGWHSSGVQTIDIDDRRLEVVWDVVMRVQNEYPKPTDEHI